MTEADERVVVANPADGGFVYWLLKLYLFGGCALLALLIASMPMVYVLVAAGAPPPPDLMAYRQQASLETRIVTADGQLLDTLVSERRYLADLDEIPPMLVKAYLAAEDRHFFDHAGVDLGGIARAALVNLRSGQVRQGGSTITQQVAKTFLSPERTIQRKLRELVLARRLEARFDKRQILFYYLNQIYLGSRAYGVKAAARVYFDKRLDQLTVAEMALLAGLARAPSRYSPRVDPERARRRRDHVLSQMREAGFIDAKQHERARAEPIRLADGVGQDPKPWLAPHFAEHVRRELVRRFGKQRVYSAGWQVSTTVDLWLQWLARRRVDIGVRALDKRQGWRGPLQRLRTDHERAEVLARIAALYGDAPLQPGRPYLTLIESVSGRGAQGHIGKQAVQIPRSSMKWAAPYSRTDAENERELEDPRQALRPGDLVWTVSPPRYQRGRGWGRAERSPTRMALEQTPRVEGAIYTYDHQTGYVLAMIGGLDYDRSTYNRCTQACRQPGSVYKPVYYSLALDQPDYSMGMILQDKPYEPEPGEVWNPQNVHGTLDGKVTMHMALVRSLNLPSIQLLVKLGADRVAQWARRLGFTTPIHADKALALGASCTRTDELARSFGIFVRGGTRMDPVYLRQIRDRNGRVIEDHTVAEDALLDEGDRLDRLWATAGQRTKQVVDPRTAFLMTRLLRDSVLHGIAARCRVVPVPTGGKGGTSSDTMDVWFVGVTSRWVTAAWMGDDSYQRPLGAKEASYTTAIPLWANFMRIAVDGRPHHELPLHRPAGLESAEIDFVTGDLPRPGSKTVKIYYRPGSWEPPEEAAVSP